MHYEMDRVVSIVTSDVIDMVQQQGGAAEKVDYLGENLLVEGMLFDDFMAEDTFAIAPEDAADDGVLLEIVEARPTSELELGQLGDEGGDFLRHGDAERLGNNLRGGAVG